MTDTWPDEDDQPGDPNRAVPHAGTTEGGSKWCTFGHAVEPDDEGLCPVHDEPVDEWD